MTGRQIFILLIVLAALAVPAATVLVLAGHEGAAGALGFGAVVAMMLLASAEEF